MKIYEMKLHPTPFQAIYEGRKTVEMRLFDERRREIKKGDKIEFTNRADGAKILVLVKECVAFPTFLELYKAYSKEKLGYLPNEAFDPRDMEQYYSREDIKRYGVLAIEIELLE